MHAYRFSRGRALLRCWFLQTRRSFGGVVLLKLMEELANNEEGEGDKEEGEGGSAAATAAGGTGIRAAMAGGAFLCSVPPSGNGPMTKRFIKEVCTARPAAVACLVSTAQPSRGIMSSVCTREGSEQGPE